MRTYAKVILISILSLPIGVFAQDYSDLIRYSRPDDLGSARFISMGGAFSSLGNDFGATSINPAGIAVYRHSEVSLSTYYRNTGTSTNYEGSPADRSDGQLRFSQIGLISHTQIDRDSHFNFGMRYHRTNDFGFDQRVNSDNINSSVVDQWFILADTYAPNGENLADMGLLYEDMANDVGLINYGASGWEQRAFGSAVTQSQSFESRGGKGIYAIDLGYQKDNLWNIGAALEIPTVRYTSNETYEESNYDAASDFNSLSWTNRYEVIGLGFQLKFGVIFTPEELGRFSAFLHTPTWWNMTQTGESTLTAYPNNSGPATSFQPFNSFNWQFTSPAKFGVGYSYVFGKHGLISADYSFQAMKYTNADSREFPGTLDFINEDIEDFVQSWHDIRVGGELRLDNWFVRGGYHLTTSPFIDNNQLAQQYSTGIGYKDNLWGVDLAYSLRTRQNQFYLYSPVLVNPVDRTELTSYFVATVYFRI